eukprot:1505283-Prymnesium_polylepis.1
MASLRNVSVSSTSVLAFWVVSTGITISHCRTRYLRRRGATANQKQQEAIRSNQRPSEATRGHQRP